MFRLVIAYLLAAVSAGSIVWCTLSTRPVSSAPAVSPAVEMDISDLLKALQAGSEVPEQRTVTTSITFDQASAAELRRIPQGRIDERQKQPKITVTHKVRMSSDDPIAQLIRNGFAPRKYSDGLRAFIDSEFGAIKINGVVLAPTTRFTPQLITTGDWTTATFTVVLLRQFPVEAQPEIIFEAPTGEILADQRTITLTPGEWRITATESLQADVENAKELTFDVGTYRVKATLAYGAYGIPDREETVRFLWEPALGLLTGVVLVIYLARALGAAWWRRQPNRDLALGVALSLAAVLVARFTGSWEHVGFVIIFGALPALAVRHAGKVVSARPPWTTNDALVVIGLGALIASGMLLWSLRHGQVEQNTLLASSALAAVSAAGSAVAFSADLGVRIVVVRLAALSAGAAIGCLAIALWTRALMAGVYPPDSVTLVMALIWALIPIAGIAVTTRAWSRVAIVAAVALALVVQGWPTDWLDAGSWSLQSDIVPSVPLTIGDVALDPVVRGALGLLLVAFILLVLRLRRLGSSITALTSPEVQFTAIALLMVFYLTSGHEEPLFGLQVPLPSLAVTSVVAWATALWLLAGQHAAHVEPATPEEHRDLVRSALHRRLLRSSEQELYRVSRTRLATGELSLEDFDRQRSAIAQDLEADGAHHPETAFATAGACSPWHNGFHAFVISLLLSLPFAFVYGLPEGKDLFTVVYNSRYLFTLAAYGFLFGFYYPRIRGTQPMTKALYLMAAVLVTELSAYVAALVDPDLSGLDKMVVVAIVTGQVALVCVGLGLYWEWRLMHLAGEPWGRVRNVRSVRSLATPLLAVVIAAGTTAATSAAGKTVDRVLKGDTSVSANR
ncbi:hypothetical protein ACIBG8_40380 [Nonomuraea sp. NPDC050556]|uniref:hypothetical protein n=1 Tax=Nonomuraea sp. NPDC050556 TaxID=3364369 RepID=UPI0037B29DD1